MPKRHHGHAPDKPDEQAGDQASHEHAGQPEDLQAELIRLLTLERDQAQDQLLRTMADLQNFRKRAAQEQQQVRQFATEQLVYDLLPVLDNFERTTAALESGASVDSIKGGVDAIVRQLRSVLDTRHVKRIDSVGRQFDPNLHEALGSVTTAEHAEGTIMEEIEPGYRMGEKVIRPARVRVAKKP